ncbi:MAG TPA: alpha/beta fold hydrolase [Blastocatellia bacterium]|nr:alpha/beta fold hydrolase [Blastocatellia bacterium]
MRERRTEKLELRAPDGQKLRGVYSRAAGDRPGPVIVFAHGFGSVRSGEKSVALETECARRGWAFAACDFRGHGESDGTMPGLRGRRLIEDLDVVTREAANRGGSPLFLFGSSMGGWASAWFAAKHPGRVAACAFVAPAFRFLEWKRLREAERSEWRRTGRLRVRNEFVDVEIDYGLTADANDYPFETLAAEFRAPAIIFHGMADETVPYSLSVEFAESCPVPEIELALFKSGDHRLNREREKLAFAACEFFTSVVVSGAENRRTEKWRTEKWKTEK